MSAVLEDPPATSTALTVVARAKLALKSDQARKDLAALVAQSVGITEIKNKAGRDQAHGAARALLKARTAIEKVGKEARDDANNFSRAVIAEEKALLAITEPEEQRLFALRDGWDQKEAEEAAALRVIESNRVQKHHDAIAAIRAFVGASVGKPAAKIEEAAIYLRKPIVDPQWQEFLPAAEAARVETLAAVEQLLAGARSHEEAAQRQAEEQRVAGIRASIGSITGLLTTAQMCRTADRVQQLIDRCATMVPTAEKYAELHGEAVAEHTRVLATLTDIHATKTADEARAADQRAESERLADERAELERQQAALAGDKRDAEIATQRLADIASGADKLVSGPVLEEHLRAISQPEAQALAAGFTEREATFSTVQKLVEETSTNPFAVITDTEILECLCDHFAQSEADMIERLSQFDFETARMGY